jgi:2-phospho-L-lactate/phosphoenolpyruvate guanylyltransferase
MWLLLPMKDFGTAKSRLSGLLTADERSRLALAMATDMLAAVTAHRGFQKVVVCSRDSRAKAMAHAHGAEFLDETRVEYPALDEVINHAVGQLQANGAIDVAVMHCDLPLLARAEIDRFLAVHRNAGTRAVTIAPDRRHLGTNLLAWRPPSDFSVQYGADSFRQHCELARSLNFELNVCELPGGGFDIDNPDDLRALALDPRLAMSPATRLLIAQNELMRGKPSRLPQQEAAAGAPG